MPSNGSFIRTAASIAWIFLAGITVAPATTITIEPDDYMAGTDISTVSPFVTLTNGRHEPIFASTFTCNGLSAPTGSMVFGSTADAACHGWASQVGGPYPADNSGFAFVAAFQQPVTEVSVVAINFGFPLDFAVEFTAFDENFTEVGFGRVNSPLGEAVSIVITGDNIRYIDLGGFSSIGALALDKLSFVVPEPGSAALLVLGLFAMVSRKRRNGEKRDNLSGPACPRLLG